MSLQIRNVTEKELTEFEFYSEQALSMFQLLPDTNPLKIVEALEEFIDHWQEGKLFTEEEKSSYILKPTVIALTIGSLWGNQLVREFGWHWASIRDDGREFYVTVSSDRSMFIAPANFLLKCLIDSNVDCTAVLIFNMLSVGKLQAIPSNAYENLPEIVRRIVPKR